MSVIILQGSININNKQRHLLGEMCNITIINVDNALNQKT